MRIMGLGIEVKGLNVRLGGTLVLKNLSFSVKPGEFLGIIGPNGAGKTTLLKTLLGLIKPESGSIQFPGHAELPAASIIGYAPQVRQIDPETPLRAWDFVSFGLPHRFRPWLTKEDRQKIKEALRLTDTERFAHKPIGKLSGGERQRLFVAQALVRNSPILLLDESTSNLDPGAQENLVAMVKRISGERSITVLFVSHDVNLIARYSDRILYITRRHYAIGRVPDVLRSDVLTRLYGMAVDVRKVGGNIMVNIEKSAGAMDLPMLPDKKPREVLLDVPV